MARARAQGKQIGWYTSGGGVFGLNFRVELPAVQSRLLLGYAAWQMKIDAYLYYGLDGWRQYYNDYTEEGSGAWIGQQMSHTLDILDFRNQVRVTTILRTSVDLQNHFCQ